MINTEILIKKDTKIIDALKLMDKLDRKLLLIVDDNIFLSVLSIGDIQRAILKKVPLEESVITITRAKICVANENDSKEKIYNEMKQRRIECMPVINNKNELVDIVFWEDINKEQPKTALNLPVVVMAGGEGTRLRPLTNLIPKPLIPIDEKTIIERIMDKFIQYNCKDFIFSVNYKADVIKDYFDNKKEKNFSVSYIKEDKPLGTAGSLYLLKNQINNTFFVSNCDILLDVDLEDLLNYHRNNGNIITVVSVLKSYQIPYGTIETSENGKLTDLNEKPEIVYQINSGVYILEPEVFEYIPENTFMHITDLIMTLKNKGKTVGVFPVSEKSWVDIGNWNEYLKVIRG